MALSLREVLTLPVFQDAEPQLLAGAVNLDRGVRWVHVAELPDIAHLLKGGELLLTTGLGIVADAGLRRRYVRELADAGIAGLVVELGRSFGRMPAEMIKEAEHHGLPLIALHHEVRYVEVTEQVHRAIISRQYELMHRVEAISREFTDLILGGAAIHQIVRHLAEIVGNPVVLEDSAHQVVEFAARDGDAAVSLLSGWEEHSRQLHREGEPGRVYRAAGSPPCTWVSIWLHHQLWGRVHVLESGQQLDEMVGLVLDRAGAALGLALLAQRDSVHVAGRASSALVSDLLAGRYGSAEDIVRRARSLGADLSSGRLVGLVVEPTNLDSMADEYGLSEEERQRVHLRVAAQLREAVREAHCSALIGLEGGQLLAVVSLGDRAGAARVLEQVAASLRTRVAASDPDLSILIGASREARPDSLQRAFEEAREAVAFAVLSGGRESVYHFGNLGTYHLLVRLAQGPELAAFVEAELSPLLEHDARAVAKLLPTLRAYLANAGRKNDTVKELWIQRRTLYGRLGRIETLLGRSLDDQDTRTRLTLALQGLDLLRQRARKRSLL